MDGHLHFASRDEFRSWLKDNCRSSDGVWLLFGKVGGPKTLTAIEALEEALSYGWIDGQMRSVSDSAYIKYFSIRRKNSKWSEKNRSITERLEKQGVMTDYGREKIAEAKKNGQWDTPKPEAIAEEQIASVSELLKEYETAYANFQGMSPSVKRTYTRAYFEAKTEAGRVSRLFWMVERLNKNLRPM